MKGSELEEERGKVTRVKQIRAETRMGTRTSIIDIDNASQCFLNDFSFPAFQLRSFTIRGQFLS